MANKIYAVKNGRKTGLFNSWDECKAQVDGYPNAVYKSFSKRSDASEYLYGKKENVKKIDVNKTEKAELVAYIDGSYDDSIGRFSYAAIMFLGDKKVCYLNCSDDAELKEIRNVAGELLAACYVMEYCVKHKIKSVEINYDYIGIEYWATKEWKAKNEFTKRYAKFTEKYLGLINITFNKIKSHSGNKYNDEVDKLAKEALYNEPKSIELEIIKDEDLIPSATELHNNKKFFDNIEWKKGKKINLENLVINEKFYNIKEINDIFKQKCKSNKIKQTEIKNIKYFFDIKSAVIYLELQKENTDVLELEITL